MRIISYDQVFRFYAETGERDKSRETVILCPGEIILVFWTACLAAGKMGGNDLRHFSQLLAVLLGPVALFSAHDIGYGACIFALAVHRRVEHRFGSALHQKRSAVGRIHSHIIILENSGLVIVIALEQSKKILFCKAAGRAENFRRILGQPLILAGSVLLLDISADNGNPVKLKTVADHFHEKFHGHRETVLFLKNLEGCGDNVIVQIPDINIAVRHRSFFSQFKSPETVAEGIAVPAVFFCAVKRPVRIFKKLVIRIAGSVFCEKTDARAAGDGIGFIFKGEFPYRLYQMHCLLDKRGMADIFEKNHKFITAGPHDDVLFVKKKLKQTGQ